MSPVSSTAWPRVALVTWPGAGHVAVGTTSGVPGVPGRPGLVVREWFASRSWVLFFVDVIYYFGWVTEEAFSVIFFQLQLLLVS